MLFDLWVMPSPMDSSPAFADSAIPMSSMFPCLTFCLWNSILRAVKSSLIVSSLRLLLCLMLSFEDEYTPISSSDSSICFSFAYLHYFLGSWFRSSYDVWSSSELALLDRLCSGLCRPILLCVALPSMKLAFSRDFSSFLILILYLIEMSSRNPSSSSPLV